MNLRQKQIIDESEIIVKLLNKRIETIQQKINTEKTVEGINKDIIDNLNQLIYKHIIKDLNNNHIDINIIIESHSIIVEYSMQFEYKNITSKVIKPFIIKRSYLNTLIKKEPYTLIKEIKKDLKFIKMLSIISKNNVYIQKNKPNQYYSELNIKTKYSAI